MRNAQIRGWVPWVVRPIFVSGRTSFGHDAERCFRL